MSRKRPTKKQAAVRKWMLYHSFQESETMRSDAMMRRHNPDAFGPTRNNREKVADSVKFDGWWEDWFRKENLFWAEQELAND